MKLLFGFAAAALLLSSAPAIAQVAPGGVPFGTGLQRGLEQQNNSGQTGFVTLFKAGTKTRMVASLEGTLRGRVQTVAIQRGKGCDQVRPGIVARSTDMRNGISRGIVPMSQDRLTSGNYVVVVYGNNSPRAKVVACGYLYQ